MGVSYQVFAVASVAGQYGRFSRVVEAIAKGRLDLVAMIDLEAGDAQAVAIVDDAVAFEFAGIDARAVGRQVLHRRCG